MEQTTMGTRIASLRREKGMTQAELAEKMGVTDKAVSKWERDLSCPDVSSLPRLAEIFGTTVDALMQSQPSRNREKKEELSLLISTILKSIPVAMGVAVVVLSAMGALNFNSAVSMLGIGLACVGVELLRKKD